MVRYQSVVVGKNNDISRLAGGYLLVRNRTIAGGAKVLERAGADSVMWGQKLWVGRALGQQDL